MTWLVTHMWVALAAAAFFGVMLGWSIRGIMLVGKLRQARVERDVTKTELEQARDEIESLYAAQRTTTPSTGAGDPALAAELQAREKRVGDLTTEITDLKDQLKGLKQGGAAAAAGVVGAAGVAVAAGQNNDEDSPSLLWRNRHLEARVNELEAKSKDAPSAAAPVAVAGGAAIAAVAVSGGADDVEADKLAWQANYLKTRVEALEGELARAETKTVSADSDDADDADESQGEELARLRWRNRFLEGRLAYFDDGTDATAEDDDVEEGSGGVAAGMAAIGAAVAGAAVATTLADDDEEANLIDADAIEDAVPAIEVEDVSDVMLSQIEPEFDEAELEALEEIEAEAFDGVDIPTDDDGFEESSDLEGAPEDDDADLGFQIADKEFVEAEDGSDDFEDDDHEADAEDEPEAYEVEPEPGEDEHDEDAELTDDDTDYEDAAAFEGEHDGEDDALEDDEVSEGEFDSEEEGDDADSDDAHSDEGEVIEDDSDEPDADDTEEFDDIEESEAEEAPEPAVVPTLANGGDTEQPLALEKPVDGAPDDLTVIGGVGPKIQEVLNSLGIWHYDQIAAWTPENVAWVDEHLNFSGRISREGWVEQADILSGDFED